MTDWIAAHEAALRIGVFMTIFALMSVAETVFPRRARVMERAGRWRIAAVFAVGGAILSRLLLMGLGLAAAWEATRQGFGLFQWLDWPAWLEILLAIILLDLLIYLQHVASHKIPILWRFHRVHHSDRDIDASTALRFHPIEIMGSMLLKVGAIALLGAAPVAVILFEIILNGCAMFNHANLRLPLGLDRALRWLIVTPDMHRSHHSVIPHETDSNYGFNLSVWDRLFGTYTVDPQGGHDAMTIGLAEYQDERPSRLGWSAVLPFLRK